ncbi:transporter substrate-binding domain-containing protein [Mesorhizobium sp.]|uniref:transporter substrate-binding domain-containing protein n=1 Tax=Mesorhizobium sp. TaxID=1871066 RepID=UPI00257B9F15|nr:transporter substrate-binding domain-containing protein [Mesorhizobium sp.]
MTEWGSLIPGLQAGRFDIITGGMYILPERCRNVVFTERLLSLPKPCSCRMAIPKDLHSFDDIRDKGLTLVTTAGSDTVTNAKDAGIPEDRVMQVAGQAEFLQTVKVGRAAAGSLNYFTVKELADKDDSVEMADPFTPPAGKAGYPSLAFLPNQQAAVDAFNEVLNTYIGSDEMMQSVGKYGYTKINLPDGTKTADLCRRWRPSNRAGQESCQTWCASVGHTTARDCSLSTNHGDDGNVRLHPKIAEFLRITCISRTKHHSCAATLTKHAQVA